MKLISYNRIIQNQFGYQKIQTLQYFKIYNEIQILAWTNSQSFSSNSATGLSAVDHLHPCVFWNRRANEGQNQRPTKTEIRTKINDIGCFFADNLFSIKYRGQKQPIWFRFLSSQKIHLTIEEPFSVLLFYNRKISFDSYFGSGGTLVTTMLMPYVGDKIQQHATSPT